MRERTGRLSLSAMALRSLLDSVSARLDESRDISRYFIGLMVFLGLLGTFWGLLGTISGVAEAIGAISVAGASDVTQLFAQLKQGLGGPLAGMGTAFSASLFGLSGSLLLGYLELLAGQAQNRFFNELEEWLSERTRLTSSMAPGDGDAPIPVYIQALLEQTADNLENLQRIVGRGEESRMQANTQMTALLDRIGGLTDQLRAQAQLMVKLAESQAEMRPVIARLAEAIQGGRFGIDEQSRTHLRSLDSQLSRVLDDNQRARQTTVQELRGDLKKLGEAQVDLRPLLSRLQRRVEDRLLRHRRAEPAASAQPRSAYGPPARGHLPRPAGIRAGHPQRDQDPHPHHRRARRRGRAALGGQSREWPSAAATGPAGISTSGPAMSMSSAPC